MLIVARGYTDKYIGLAIGTYIQKYTICIPTFIYIHEKLFFYVKFLHRLHGYL